MKCFDWKLEESKYLGSVHRPVAEISIRDRNNEWKELSVYVDSGADISVLQRSFGELLGIDMESGKFAVFEGAGGGKIEAFIHKVTLRIGDYHLETDVAFCKNPETLIPNIIGRFNIFDELEIDFKNLNRQTCFVKVTRE